MFLAENYRLIKIILCSIIIVLIFLGHVLNFTYDEPSADQRQYLAYAYNSLKYGIYDQTSSDNPYPDYRREPLYPAVLMVSMILNPFVSVSNQNAKCITLGRGCLERIVSLKITNLLFLILTAAISAYSVKIYCRSLVPGLICFLIVSLSGSLGFLANTFYSEVFVAFLILMLSSTFYLLVKNRFQTRMLIIFGSLLGLIALTKAIFLYFLIVSIFYIFFKSHADSKSLKLSFKRSIIVLIVSLCLITPWMIRNYFRFNSFSIAGGSGVVLVTRANYNDMSHKDYIYFNLLNLRGVGRWIATALSIEIDQASLEKRFKKKYKYSATKYRRTLSKEMKLSRRNPELNRLMVHSAQDRIFHNFSDHLLMTLPMLIRGSFPEIGYGYIPNDEYRYHGIRRDGISLGAKLFNIDISKYWLSLPTISNIIYIFAFYAVVLILITKRKWESFSFLLPGLYSIFMYSFFTHYIPRYSVPLIPIFAVCSVLLIYNIQQYLRSVISKTNLTIS